MMTWSDPREGAAVLSLHPTLAHTHKNAVRLRASVRAR